MAGLPTNVSICTVVGRLASTEQVANSDPEPDVVPLTGKVIFRASVPHVIHASSNTIFVPQKIEAVLDSQGNFSAQLVASDDPDLSPYNWTYNVSFQLANAVIAPFNFIAKGGTTMEISLITPVASSTGIPVTIGGDGPQGPPGPPGADGDDGQSAYELAVQQGFVGDINAWLASLEGPAGPPGATDHGALTGLADDDHTQYLNNTRGDARYYVKSNTYTKAEVDAAVAGAAGTTDHGLLTGLADDDHPQYHNNTRGDVRYYTKAQVDTLVAGGSTDHGALIGLADDDHTQYFNQTRGDARYSLTTHNHDSRYYTETEIDSMLSSAGATQTIEAKTASYTLVATDLGKLITMNSGSAMTLSVPTDASVTWPVGGRVDVLVINTGMVTFNAVTPGTTSINGTPSLISRAQWSAVSLIKRAANAWVVIGDLT